MADYKMIGNGGMWEKKGKNGMYLSFSLTFEWEGEKIQVSGVAFPNEEVEGNKPNWKVKVNEAKIKGAAKPKEPETWDPATENLPF